MMIHLIQLILELVGKGDTENHTAYGLIGNQTSDHCTYVTSARMSMNVLVGVLKQEGNFANYWNLIVYKLYVINCNFVDDYWDTALVQYFFL